MAVLGPGTGLKRGVKKKNLTEGEETQKLHPYPPIPPETQDLVHRALGVAGDHEMTESQVKGLVAHIKAGGEPEQYKSIKAVGSSPYATPLRPKGFEGQAASGDRSQSIGHKTPNRHTLKRLKIRKKLTVGSRQQNTQPQPQRLDRTAGPRCDRLPPRTANSFQIGPASFSRF